MVQEARYNYEQWLSRGNGLRFMVRGQEARVGHAQAWWVAKQQKRYDKLHRVKTQHASLTTRDIQVRAVAKNEELMARADAWDAGAPLDADQATFGLLQTQAAFKAGDAIFDPHELGKLTRKELIVQMHGGLVAHSWATPIQKAKELIKGKQVAYVIDPAYLNATQRAVLMTAQTKHARFTRRISKSHAKIRVRMDRREAEFNKLAEAANSEQRIIDELAKVNEELSKIVTDPMVIRGGARYTKGPKAGQEIPRPNRQQLQRYENEERIHLHEVAKRLEEQREYAKWARERRAKLEEQLNADRLQMKQDNGELYRLYEDVERIKRESTSLHFSEHADNPQKWTEYVENFGAHATTTDIRYAMRSPDGGVYMIDKHTPYNLGIEGGRSIRFLHLLVHKPTKVWKRMVLGYTPRIVTNNGVGNTLMVAAAHPSALLGIMEGFRWRFSAPERTKWMKVHNITGDADLATLFQSDHYLHRYFQDELMDVYGAAEGIKTELVNPGVKGRLATGFYGATKAIAEDPLRAGVIMHTLRKSPEFKALRKKLAKKHPNKVGGELNDMTANALLAWDAKHNNGIIRSRMAHESRKVLGDYVTMTEAEKWARDLIPFYMWDKHILKATANLVADSPGRVSVGVRLGQLGSEWMDEFMGGEAPDYFRSGIPLSALGLASGMGDRQRFLLTASLNPWATPGQLAEVAESFVVGADHRMAAFNELNPFLSSIVSSATERDLLSGAFRPRQGPLLADVADMVAESVPYLKPGRELAAGKDDSRLITKGDWESTITRLLGVPVREVSRKGAVKAGNPTQRR